MNILLLFADQCSSGFLYLFLPLCSDGEILLGFGAVEGEMRGEPPPAVVSVLWDLQLGSGKLSYVT